MEIKKIKRNNYFLRDDLRKGCDVLFIEKMGTPDYPNHGSVILIGEGAFYTGYLNHEFHLDDVRKDGSF